MTVVRFLIVFLIASFGVGATASTILVDGWLAPQVSTKSPPSWLGNDPILGRLSCPPLSRMKLKSGRSDPLVLKRLQVKDHKGKISWVLTPRTGIYWWSGEEVSSEDLGLWYQTNLNSIFSEKLSGEAVIPNFTVKTSKSKVEILWSDPPPSGPYIVDGLPLWRPLRQGFECAGIYKMNLEEGEYLLEPSAGYKKNRPNIVIRNSYGLQSSGPVIREPSMLIEVKTRGSEVEPSCKRLIPLPEVHSLEWNPKHALSQSSRFREWFSKAIPRHTWAAASLNYVKESRHFVLEPHPGAVDPEKLPSYKKLFKDLQDILKDSSKLSPGNALLTIQKPEHTGYLEKLLQDRLRSFGLTVEVVGENPGIRPVAHYYPGFSYDLKGIVETNSFRFSELSDSAKSQWARDVLSYQVSLTKGVLDVPLFRRLSGQVLAQSMITPMFQQLACVEKTSRGGKTESPQIDVLNPDWFRRLIRQ